MNDTTVSSDSPGRPKSARKPRASATSATTEAMGAAGVTGEAETPPARARFARAIEEAKAGAEQLSKEAQDRALKMSKEAQARAGEYRGKMAAASSDWMNEARVRGEEAKGIAADLAREGKAKASEAMTALGKLVEENATLVDEKVGAKYGDYARKAASTMQDTAAKLDAKELDELGEDAKEFVRKSPALAVGLAAAAGFMLARMFRGSKD